MQLMSILSGNGFVMYNKTLAKKVSVNGSILFGQLCSSYESFSKKNMITVRDDTEYFFLTSETITKETSLSYKQQVKAIKDLEAYGYIKTKLMGVPSKKHFHITDKIYQELLLDINSSSDKREELNDSFTQQPLSQKDNTSLEQRAKLEIPKGEGKSGNKGSCIKKKNKKEINKKEQYKNILEEEGELAKSSSLKFKSEFSSEEIRAGSQFIAIQMTSTFKELNLSQDFKNRLICYMYMSGMRYFSPKEYRTKYIQIEQGNTKVIDKAYYIIKGILLNRETKNADSISYQHEKTRKRQLEIEEFQANLSPRQPVMLYNWIEE